MHLPAILMMFKDLLINSTLSNDPEGRFGLKADNVDITTDVYAPNTHGHRFVSIHPWGLVENEQREKDNPMLRLRYTFGVTVSEKTREIPGDRRAEEIFLKKFSLGVLNSVVTAFILREGKSNIINNIFMYRDYLGLASDFGYDPFADYSVVGSLTLISSETVPQPRDVEFFYKDTPGDFDSLRPAGHSLTTVFRTPLFVRDDNC